jgi:2-(1,2-epoxy-1,2-dihydrophenyl)acetyl-CoA isomerase
MTATVLLETSEGVATITLNRPDAYNSLDTATKNTLRDHVLEVAVDPAIRAVVLTGTGKAFCTGQDLAEHARMLADDPQTTFSTVREHYNPIIAALVTMPKPVVAAVNGVAAGAGAGFALAADFRIIADNTRFNLAFANVGLTADSGVSWTLPRLVGSARATELLMLPETLNAQQMVELGLAQRVVPADELTAAAVALAARLANGPTAAFAAIKESLAYSGAHSLVESLEHEAVLQQSVGLSADHANAVIAFNAKQVPVFTGL